MSRSNGLLLLAENSLAASAGTGTLHTTNWIPEGTTEIQTLIIGREILGISALT